MQQPSGESRRSVWPYIGVGCLVVTLTLVIGVCGLAYYGMRGAKKFAEQFRDPEKRRERVIELLGAGDLPEGYEPVVAMSVPFALDMAVIGDAVPNENGKIEEFGDHAFIYLSLNGSLVRGDDAERLDRFFAGQEGGGLDNDTIRIDNVDLSRGELLGTAQAETRGNPVDVVALKVQVKTRSGWEPRLLSALRIRCRGDARVRLGLWFEPLSGGDPGPPPDLAGTNADPARIGPFLDRFALCP
ncbi:MAG: hypothetical protein Kow0062_13000 [Acidobacteriota bacterium]|nr:MAG: hypothetical protein D6738_14805 [Acidobacteriota bacterium]